VVQVGALQRAAVGAPQVAKLGAQLNAALGQYPRGEGQVVIRRQVEVIRQGKLHAPGGGRSVGGQQKARLALLPDGEGQVGRIKNRDILEVERAVARHPFI